MEDYRFQVNLGGMIEILSDHLYSSPDVYIRELLQNGVDAIVAREKVDDDFREQEKGKLLVSIDDKKCLSFRDNGVGLTKEEVHKFLAVIGESSKKDLETGKILSDYIGRFGIGLLSCFMVSDEICVRTRSIREEKGYEWIGKRDGTYTLCELEDEVQAGTEILLAAKYGCEEYFTCEKVESLILHYGLILPYSVQASVKQDNLIYLKNMLLTEKGESILPDWAVFTKCIINAKELRPTASREGFYEDETLRQAKKELGQCIANYLRHMSKSNPAAFAQFLDIHELVVRSMAIADDELFRLFIDELRFETTRGTLTGFELRMTKEPLLYCGLKEYKQLSQVFLAQNHLLINTGYVYTYELLNKMQYFFDVNVQKVDSYEVGELLKDVNLEQAEQAIDFLEVAERVLAPFGCGVEVKQFIPANLPAFYYLDSEAVLYREIEEAMNESEDLFSDMLGNFKDELKPHQTATLYFNMRNPLVQKMVQQHPDTKLEDIIIIIYVQTLLIGGFTLRNNELGMMNDKLLSVLEGGLADE